MLRPHAPLPPPALQPLFAAALLLLAMLGNIISVHAHRGQSGNMLQRLCEATLSAPEQALFQDIQRPSRGAIRSTPSRVYYADYESEPVAIAAAPTPQTTVTWAEAQLLLHFMASYEPFHCQITGGGCDSRAAAMNWLLEQMGVDSRKIYVIGQASALTVSGKIEPWSHHVAPVVRLAHAADPTLPPDLAPGMDLVLDPALDRAPITVGEWLSRFGQSHYNKELGHYIELIDRPLGEKPNPQTTDREPTQPVNRNYYYITDRFDDHHAPDRYLYQDGWNAAVILAYETAMIELLDHSIRRERQRTERAQRTQRSRR